MRTARCAGHCAGVSDSGGLYDRLTATSAPAVDRMTYACENITLP